MSGSLLWCCEGFFEGLENPSIGCQNRALPSCNAGTASAAALRWVAIKRAKISFLARPSVQQKSPFREWAQSSASDFWLLLLSNSKHQRNWPLSLFCPFLGKLFKQRCVISSSGSEKNARRDSSQVDPCLLCYLKDPNFTRSAVQMNRFFDPLSPYLTFSWGSRKKTLALKPALMHIFPLFVNCVAQWAIIYNPKKCQNFWANIKMAKVMNKNWHKRFNQSAKCSAGPPSPNIKICGLQQCRY